MTNYIHLDGQTIARTKSTAASNYLNHVPTYLHHDHLGSAVAATNVAGAVEWTERYTPFGISLDNNAANDNQAGFTGHIKDTDTGLTYMQARYYDPVVSRFLSHDPVGFSVEQPLMFNRYGYVENNPVNWIDAFGLAKAKNWRDAERKAAQGLRAKGHRIISFQQKGNTIFASRNGDNYFFGRKYDIISVSSSGQIFATEVKFRKDAGKKKSLIEKVFRKVNPLKKVWLPISIGNAVGVARQIHFDATLNSDITLSGPGARQIPGQELSETSGDIEIRWELWSSEKDDFSFNVSDIKKLSSDEEKQKHKEEIINRLMEQLSTQ